MPVQITYSFSCGGCEKTATGKTRMVCRKFTSVSGRSYGIGSYAIVTPPPDPPEGWIAFDPYTSCCYCPDCWADIEGVKVIIKKGDAMKTTHKPGPLLAALESIEELLAFYEGTEERISETSHPTIEINADPGDGDFQTMLGIAREAIKKAKGE